MMGAGLNEVATSSDGAAELLSNKRTLGKKASKWALKTKKPAADKPNDQAQTVNTSDNNSRTTSEPSGRVTFAPLPTKDGEQLHSTAIQQGSVRTSDEHGRLSQGSKESASQSNLRHKFKALFSKKSMRNLRAGAHDSTTAATLDGSQDPAHHVPQSPFVNGPDLRLENQTRDQAQGQKGSLGDMILANRRVSMSVRRSHHPGMMKLAPRELRSLPEKVGDIQILFWEDPRVPRPLHAGVKFEKPRTQSTWALRNKLAYRLNPATGRAEPSWKIELDLHLILTVAVRQLRATGFPRFKEHHFEISFSSEDAWMRKYLITGTNTKTGNVYKCYLCLCLPQFPGYKLLSLVATMAYVAMNTNLQVPLTICYDATTRNPLLMEYIMMTRPEGKTYSSVENELGLDAKKTFARSVADCVDQLSKLAFSDIGSLYHGPSGGFEDDNSYFVGIMTEPHTTRDMRVDYELRRGPFSTLREYYNAQIEVVRLEAKDPRQQDRLDWFFPPPNHPHPDDDIERDNAKKEMLLRGLGLPQEMPLPKEDGLWEFMPAPSYTNDDLKMLPTICEALQQILPLLVSSQELDPGATRVFHFNLSKNNVLVNEAGEITGILGWENAWVAPPELLQKYPPCIPNLNEEDPDDYLDIDPNNGEGEQEDNWEEMTMAMEYEDRLRELGSAHLDVLEYQRNPKLVQLERFLRKPPSMNAFMEFLDSVDKKDEDHPQRDSVMENDGTDMI
ncbi:hypothetical protein HDK90DRAFT_512048 [Phyllosticta capitalensis]|uniref:Aminoglycoside phosphotransferase domain-containing protein n=1 Tax=Phyllosticta capitalensis TaxID=121624 RepID=A0ABR1YKS5_9PEZI